MFNIFNRDLDFRVHPVGANVTTEGYMAVTDGHVCRVATVIIREDPLAFRPAVYYRISPTKDYSAYAPYVVAEKFVRPWHTLSETYTDLTKKED